MCSRIFHLYWNNAIQTNGQIVNCLCVRLKQRNIHKNIRSHFFGEIKTERIVTLLRFEPVRL